jgi:hypothetical protein
MSSLLQDDRELERRLQESDDTNVKIHLRILFSRGGDTYKVPRFIHREYQNLIQRVDHFRVCSTR